MNEPCYLSKPGRCASIPHGHNLQRLPHGHKPRSLSHDHELWRLIPSVGWSSWGLGRHRNLAQQHQLCEMLRLPETHQISMWSSIYSANRQVATVSPFALSRMTLCQMSLSRMSLSGMARSRMTLSRMSLSRMTLSPMSLCPMSLSLMSLP